MKKKTVRRFETVPIPQGLEKIINRHKTVEKVIKKVEPYTLAEVEENFSHARQRHTVINRSGHASTDWHGLRMPD